MVVFNPQGICSIYCFNLPRVRKNGSRWQWDQWRRVLNRKTRNPALCFAESEYDKLCKKKKKKAKIFRARGVTVTGLQSNAIIFSKIFNLTTQRDVKLVCNSSRNRQSVTSAAPGTLSSLFWFAGPHCWVTPALGDPRILNCGRLLSALAHTHKFDCRLPAQREMVESQTNWVASEHSRTSRKPESQMFFSGAGGWYCGESASECWTSFNRWWEGEPQLNAYVACFPRGCVSNV